MIDKDVMTFIICLDVDVVDKYYRTRVKRCSDLNPEYWILKIKN